MIDGKNSTSAATFGRDLAYTTPRLDILDLVPKSANCVLDVGCSNGELGHSLKKIKAGRQVFGLEYDEQFVIEASRRLDGVTRADLNSFVWRDTFLGRSFDCIIFADVLEHLIDPRKSVQQACEYLQPGGCMVVSIPNIRHMSAFGAIFLRGNFPQNDRGIFDRTHLRWFTISDARKLLSDCGLAVTECVVTLRWGDMGGGRVNRTLNRLPRWFKNWGPVRELLTYQVCLRARRSA
jgi:SAM-dependent methyltransferase